MDRGDSKAPGDAPDTPDPRPQASFGRHPARPPSSPPRPPRAAARSACRLLRLSLSPDHVLPREVAFARLWRRNLLGLGRLLHVQHDLPGRFGVPLEQTVEREPSRALGERVEGLGQLARGELIPAQREQRVPHRVAHRAIGIVEHPDQRRRRARVPHPAERGHGGGAGVPETRAEILDERSQHRLPHRGEHAGGLVPQEPALLLQDVEEHFDRILARILGELRDPAELLLRIPVPQLFPEPCNVLRYHGYRSLARATSRSPPRLLSGAMPPVPVNTSQTVARRWSTPAPVAPEIQPPQRAPPSRTGGPPCASPLLRSERLIAMTVGFLVKSSLYSRSSRFSFSLSPAGSSEALSISMRSVCVRWMWRRNSWPSPLP